MLSRTLPIAHTLLHPEAPWLYHISVPDNIRPIDSIDPETILHFGNRTYHWVDPEVINIAVPVITPFDFIYLTLIILDLPHDFLLDRTSYYCFVQISYRHLERAHPPCAPQA